MSTRRSSRAIVFLLIAASLGWTHSATAAEFPQRMRAGNHSLMLNGWGARKKTFLQLYTAGLYLKQPSSSPAEIVAANEPMAIRIEVTSGFVSQSKLVASLEEGFRQATAGNIGPIENEMAQFRNCFQEAITKGDVFDLVYVPEHGVIVNKNGGFRGVIAGAEFKQALFRIWLSDTPVDGALKQAMLMQESDFTLKGHVLRVQITGKECDGFRYSIGFTRHDEEDFICL